MSTITLPSAPRLATTRSASAPCSSGKWCPITGFSSPASYQRNSCSKSPALPTGSIRADAPVRDADERHRLQEDEIEPHRGDLARGEPDHQVAAVPREAAQVFTEVTATHRVEHNVDAGASGELLDTRRQPLLVIVDRCVGAALLDDRQLVGATRRADHVRAHRLRNLDRRRPGSARAPEHEDALPRFELAAARQPVNGCAIREVERGGLVPPHGVGDPEHLVGARRRCNHLARERTDSGHREHAIADREAVDIGAHLGQRARRLVTGHERWVVLVLVLTADHERVGEVHRRRAHRDAHVTRPALQSGKLLDAQDFLATELGTHQCQHVAQGTWGGHRICEVRPPRGLPGCGV